jgi:hypothetical protein
MFHLNVFTYLRIHAASKTEEHHRCDNLTYHEHIQFLVRGGATSLRPLYAVTIRFRYGNNFTFNTVDVQNDQ